MDPETAGGFVLDELYELVALGYVTFKGAANNGPERGVTLTSAGIALLTRCRDGSALTRPPSADAREELPGRHSWRPGSTQFSLSLHR